MPNYCSKKCRSRAASPLFRSGDCQPWLRTIVLLIASIALSANAQQTEQNPSPRQAMVIDEIIVTVSRREESLQEVLGSVSAVTSETLQRENIQNFNDLVQLIPGMVAQDEEKIAIRGISRTREGPSPVAFHVNDVFIAERGEPFFDLEAIEILRGPSGTLYGRNATAGAINAKWHRPEDRFGGSGNVRYSNLEDRQLRAHVNLPLLGEGDSRLLGRISAIQRKSDGTLDNLLLPDDKGPNNIDDRAVRLFLTSEPSDNLSLGLRAIRYENTPGGTFLVFSPSLETRRSGVLERLGAQPLPDDTTKVRSRVNERFGENFKKFTRIDGDITWSLDSLPWLGDLDAVLVGGEQRGDGRDVFDLDGTEEPITEGRTRISDDIRRTAELRFVSQNDTGFDWLLGLFWYKQTSVKDLHVKARTFIAPSDLGLAPAFSGEPKVVADADVFSNGEQHLDNSRAIYLNLDFDLARLLGWADVQITAGLRQNRDRFQLKTRQSLIQATFRDVGTTLLPPLGAGPFTVVDESNLVQDAKFNETTGEFGARWFYSEEGMLYIRLSRGYKPGLAQRLDRADGTSTQNPVDPEFLDAFEIGWKTNFFDRRLQLNLAAYLYDYKDLQVSQITPGGVMTENAASATINGLEAEMQWSPTEAFFLQASAAWTDATYDEYCGSDPARADDGVEAGCNAENPLDFSGARMTAAPRYSAALLASYTFMLGEFGTLIPSIRTSWTDELDRRGLGNPIDRVKSHSSSDARLTWNSPQQRFKVELFVENIEDHNDIFFQAFTPVATGSEPGSYSMVSNLPPRVYGLNLEARF